MSTRKTKDPVNQSLIDLEDTIGLQSLGSMSNLTWYSDPKRFAFTLSRYKFVAKMLSGYGRVAEIGCGDGFASRIVRQSVGSLLISDYDSYFIERFKRAKIHGDNLEINAITHDILSAPLSGEKFDAIYSLDVLEHIPISKEMAFIKNICDSLSKHGVVILGMPSVESQVFASPLSKEGHINCKSGEEFRTAMEGYFNNVFIFSMNDEVVHTGFFPMAQYLIAVCCSKKKVFEEAN